MLKPTSVLLASSQESKQISYWPEGSAYLNIVASAVILDYIIKLGSLPKQGKFWCFYRLLSQVYHVTAHKWEIDISHCKCSFANQLITKIETWLSVHCTHNLERISFDTSPLRRLRFTLHRCRELSPNPLHFIFRVTKLFSWGEGLTQSLSRNNLDETITDPKYKHLFSTYSFGSIVSNKHELNRAGVAFK